MPDYLHKPMQVYLDGLASGEPTPGGGSAAGLTGALGAALLCMSARFTIGREKYTDFDAAAREVLAEAEPLGVELQALMNADAEAYGAYRAASSLPRTTPDEQAARRAALQAATRDSAQVPLAIVRTSFRLLTLAERLAANCNPYLVSDVAVATHHALAAFRSALVNVRLNLVSLDDTAYVQTVEAELAPLAQAAPRTAQAALEIAYRVMALPIEGDLPA